MLKEKIILDMLNKESVSIVRQKYFVDGEIEYLSGELWRRAYYNTNEGIKLIKSEIEEPYLSVVLKMWEIA